MKPEEVVPYLLDRQLLDARDLVQGDVRVEDHSARHQNFAVRCTTRPGFFLKHAPPGDVVGTLESEAGFYALVNGASRLNTLKPYVPDFLRYDADGHTLTVALVANAVNARAGAKATRDGSSEIAAQLGRALAACHSAGRQDDPATRAAFSEMWPWAFHIAMPSPALFRDIGPLQLELIRIVQREPDMIDRFRAMRRAWEFSSFTHGDIRWTNILVEPPAAIRLIDWEAAGIGDPAWDVASAFDAWLSRGLETLELKPGDGPAEASSHFASALPAIQDHTRTFWHAYANASRLVGDEQREFLDRATTYTCARLLQSAYEWSAGRTSFSAFVLMTIQLAVNLARQSAPARAAVLGIESR